MNAPRSTESKAAVLRTAAVLLVVITPISGCSLLRAAEHAATPAPRPEPEPSDQQVAVEPAPRPVPGLHSDSPPPYTLPSLAVGRALAPRALAAPDPRLDPVRRPVAGLRSPPNGPPDDPFGYHAPIRGCFEGRVYVMPEQSPGLPRDYRRLDHVDTLWACEWNVPYQLRERGFGSAPERTEWFAIRYVGGINVRTAGTYGFRISSDDAVRLLVDGRVVVVDDGRHAPRFSHGEIELEPGDHTMWLEYFQAGGNVNLQVFVTPPGGDQGLLTVRYAARSASAER